MWFKVPETFKPQPKKSDANIVSISIGGKIMKIK